MQPQAVREHARTTVVAGHFAREAVAAVLRLHDGERRQHHVSISQQPKVGGSLVAVVYDHLIAQHHDLTSGQTDDQRAGLQWPFHMWSLVDVVSRVGCYHLKT